MHQGTVIKCADDLIHFAAAETIVKHARGLVPSFTHLVLLVAQSDLLGELCYKKLDVVVLALSIY